MWSPPKTGLLETRVPYRPLEPRVLCSENEVVYTHGIHLKALETWFPKSEIKPWRFDFQIVVDINPRGFSLGLYSSYITFRS